MLAACTTSGTAAQQAASGVAVPTITSSCPPSDNGHPWIVFASPLSSTDRMTVDGRGFVTTSSVAQDIGITGDPCTVRVQTDQHTKTSDCGRRKSTLYWVEIHAIRSGRATITVPGRDPADRSVIRLTVER